MVQSTQRRKGVPEQTNRRTRDSDVARGAILAAAEEHFARFGFSGARIDAIAEASGYNKSLIFHYFTDKLGLYRAVVSCLKGDQEQQSFAHIARFIGEDPPPLTRATVRDLIASMAGSWFDRMQQRPNLRRIFMWEAAEEWQTLAHLPSMPNMAQHMRDLVQFVRRAQAAGFIRPSIDLEFMIVIVPLITMIEAASARRYTLLFPERDCTSPTARAHIRAQFIDMVLHGIMTPSVEHSDAV
jgi:TetR/AcrR family transcriptional regulator